MDQADPHADAPPAWRRLARHATTLLLIGLASALVAPTVATMLLALRTNGLSHELAYAIMIAPLAILFAGPGAFVLGIVFGWMLLVLAAQGVSALPVRIALALLISTLAWWLAEPLPPDGTGAAPGTAAPERPDPAGDWLIWCASAAATALIFTRAWVAHRLRHPTPVPQDPPGD